MAIFSTGTNNPEFTTPYVPGATNSFPGIGCVDAGDRIIIKQITWKSFSPGVSNVSADSNGFFPHMVYRPSYGRQKDPRTFPHQDELDQVFGNDSYPPEIRMDLGSFYARWAGQWSIEGGTGPGGDAGTLLISWTWDRPRAKRQGIFMRATKALERIARTVLEQNAGLRDELMRDGWTRGIPVDQAGIIANTFTIWNAPGVSIIGAPTFFTRPQMAQKILTPENQPLILSNGTGTTQSAFNNQSSQPIPIGPFTQIAFGGAPGATTNLIFVVEY